MYSATVLGGAASGLNFERTSAGPSSMAQYVVVILYPRRIHIAYAIIIFWWGSLGYLRVKENRYSAKLYPNA